MGTVLKFTPRTKSTPSNAPAQGGQVLMFTGVRYQRHDSEPQEQLHLQRRKG